jgi:4'-phosphopantetheinyl transferase
MNVYWLEQTEADVPAENDWLSASEAVCLSGMRFLKRRADWRLGRWTAKCALSIYLNIPAHPEVFRKMEIRPASSGAPEAFFANQPAGGTISLSHSSGIAACTVAAPGVELGCDLEMAEPRSDAFVADYFTLEEQALVAHASAPDRPRLLALLWSAKESALKALRVGLRLDTRTVIAIPCATSFDRNGWSQLRVRHTGDHSAGAQVFHGWWHQADNILRTVVAAPTPDAPIPLTIPAHFFDSASHWKPVAS